MARNMERKRALCAQAIDQYIQKHGALPRHYNFGRKGSLPTAATVKNLFGMSAVAYLRQNYPDIPQWAERKKWDRESCIQSVDAFIGKHGRRPRTGIVKG